ncbi:MAG: hypothetical protein AAF363_15660 [Bacteroidota bacterium]
MEDLSKLVELIKKEAPQARVKVDDLMVTHYFTLEELLNICNSYAEYKSKSNSETELNFNNQLKN